MTKAPILDGWIRKALSPRIFWKTLRTTLVWVLALDILLAAFFEYEIQQKALQTVWVYKPWAVLWIGWSLTAVLVPYALRAWFERVESMDSFFKKRLGLFVGAVVLPFCSFFLFESLLRLALGRYWVSLALMETLVPGLVVLTLASIAFAAKISTNRTIDSMRLLSNGMEMASKLDFDHPIVTYRTDEIGQVSDQFNRMQELLKTRVNVLQALFDNIRIFSGMLKQERILEHSVASFKSLEQAGQIVIGLWDEETGRISVERCSLDRPEVMGLSFAPGEGVLGQVARTRQFQAWTPGEYTQTARMSDAEAKLWGKGSNAICLPMLFKGELKGAVAFYDVDYERFARDRKMDYLQALANQIAIFLENARLYRMVIQDRLTGLFVHSFIEGELENLLAQAQRYKFPVSFIMFDVDKFKQINDTYGHTAGNELLRAVSQAIRNVSREADSPGRYGGDEFEIILPHTDKEGALVYAEKLRKGIEQMEVVLPEGVKTRVTVSVGLASYPQDAQNSTDLQAAADSALYGAKAMGRNCVVLYQPPQGGRSAN